MKRTWSVLTIAVFLGITLVFFQNCSPGFKSTGGQVVSASTSDTARLSAIAVLKANCAACHNAGGSASHAPFGSYTTDLEFINSGLIVAGEVDTSKLLLRIKTDTQAGGIRNMPPTSTLSSKDYNTLVSWVMQMGAQVNPYQCDAQMSLAQTMPPNELKRLSRRQYLKTLQDLLARGVASSTAQSLISTALTGVILPTDDSSEFSRLDSSVSQQHIRAYFDVSDRLATALVADPNYSTFVTAFINISPGSCTSINTSSLSSACASQFIRNFGSRALRRPLATTPTNEPTLYLDAYTAAGGGRAGVGAVVFRLLMAPEFLHKVEDRETLTASARLYRLSSYSIASRLSYLFWNSMPDEQLFSLASSSDLSTDANFATALSYVANHANTVDSVREYMSEWLKLSRVPQFATNNSALNYLANGISLDSSLRLAMLSEVEELGSYVYNQDLPFSELFTSNVSFARDSRLMSIYGLSQAAAATVTPQNAVRFPASERSGLLTRAALLSFGTELANPIKRGVRIRREILCIPINSPPPEFADQLTPPEINVNATTRERYDHKTSQQACTACHQYINVLGHSLGSYNAFGQYQTQEPTFDANGNFSGNRLTVNTAVDLSVAVSPTLRASNAGEFSRIVASQRSTQTCFSEKYFKFAMGRPADVASDGCRLNSVFSRIRNSNSLKDVMKAVAEDQAFRHRLKGQ